MRKGHIKIYTPECEGKPVAGFGTQVVIVTEDGEEILLKMAKKFC